MLRLNLEFAYFSKRKKVLSNDLWSIVFSFSAPKELVSVISRINKASAKSADALIRKNTNNVLQWRVDNVLSLHYLMNIAKFREAHYSLQCFNVGYEFWKMSSYLDPNYPKDDAALIKCQQDFETELQNLDNKFESKVHEDFKGDCGLLNCCLSSFCCIGALIPALTCAPIPGLYAYIGSGGGSMVITAGNLLLKKPIYDKCAEACCLWMMDSRVAEIKDHLVEMKELTGIPAGLRKKSLFEKELSFFHMAHAPQVENDKDDQLDTINFII